MFIAAVLDDVPYVKYSVFDRIKYSVFDRNCSHDVISK